MNYNPDTIAAVSTAWGEAGIAIVRMSGPDAVKIADLILRYSNSKCAHLELKPREMRLAYLLDETEQVIDRVLTVYFPSPKSYTGEDLFEIHTHGGTLVVHTCLVALLHNGARLAEPGEFTKRAFLNGRIDLAQAESVLGIIQAQSTEALHAASRTLAGELSGFVRAVHDEILVLQGDLEVGLDFPEGEPPIIEPETLYKSLVSFKTKLHDLEDRCNAGAILREGLRVVISGRPNVGKSSLLNALLKQSRAIVTPIPGTTRDIIEESITWQGVPIRLVDTAGLRDDPADEIEATGIERTQQALREADICLRLIDSSCPLESQLENQVSERDSDYAFHTQNCIFVLTKSDLSAVVTEQDIKTKILVAGNSSEKEISVLSVSAKTGAGLDELKDAIVSLAVTGHTGAIDTGLNVTTRQLEDIREAIRAIDDALDVTDCDLGQDILAGLIGTARVALERLLGISCDDILLDSVFSRFCVGK